jgi:hypothetical protein
VKSPEEVKKLRRKRAGERDSAREKEKEMASTRRRERPEQGAKASRAKSGEKGSGLCEGGRERKSRTVTAVLPPPTGDPYGRWLSRSPSCSLVSRLLFCPEPSL